MGTRLETANDPTLPEGVALHPLASHADQRGEFTELFRNHWHDTPLPQQWNLVRSRPNTLRGVHVHLKHWDYVCVITGQLIVGLHDLRAADPRSSVLQLDADHLCLLTIPPGVAHGFYSKQATACLLGASRYYDPSDHARCRWNCPELGLDWQCTAPELSDQDAQAGGYGPFRAAAQASLANRLAPGSPRL